MPFGCLRQAVCCVQNATTFLPNVGVRFDYSQSVGSPFVSIYYSDRVSTGGNNPANPSSNLKLAQGVSPRPLVSCQPLHAPG